MQPPDFLYTIVDPGLNLISELGGPKPTDDVRRFLLAVAMQESGRALEARYQNSPGPVPGPARGFWQFERTGGVHGVLTHGASKSLAKQLCEACAVHSDTSAVWRALEGHDLLATGFARLLLFTDTHPVPTTEEAAWDCYCNRLWRPGAPHPETWHENWEAAGSTVAARVP